MGFEQCKQLILVLQFKYSPLKYFQNKREEAGQKKVRIT